MRGVCTQLSADVTEVIAVPGQCDGVTGRGKNLRSILSRKCLRERGEQDNQDG